MKASMITIGYLFFPPTLENVQEYKCRFLQQQNALPSTRGGESGVADFLRNSPYDITTTCSTMRKRDQWSCVNGTGSI